MASFYLNADGHHDAPQGKYTDQVDGCWALAKYFAVDLIYLGAHVPSNMYCRVKQMSESGPKKEMEDLFMTCLTKIGLAGDNKDRTLLTMLEIMALATHNLRSLNHYEMILRTISWNVITKSTLDRVFGKAEHYARTVLVLISCIHYYYSNLWRELHTKHGIPEFDSDWISASKPICDKARTRYNAAVCKRTDLARLAGSTASISEPGPGFTRWRIPTEESDQWECN